MDTPPVGIKKSLSNSLTKSCLTPCRRVGLGRPSSSSKKTLQPRMISSPAENKSPLLEEVKSVTIPEVSLTIPLKTSDILNKSEVRGVKRRLVTGSKIPPKDAKLNSSFCSDSSTSFLDSESEEKVCSATPEVIEQLALSIIEKNERLERLKIQATYANQHKLEELQAQTARWRAAGREALHYSMSLARDAGYSVTLKELMSQHGFPEQLMGYNAQDDEFD